MPTIKYRAVPQAYGAIEPIAGSQYCRCIRTLVVASKIHLVLAPPEFGTDGLGSCVGVYFELAQTSALFTRFIFPSTSLMVFLECFVGHLDTDTRGDTVARVTALAKATRDGFYATIKAKFPGETFSGFQNLTLVANQGEVTSSALAWGVNEAFRKMEDPNYQMQDPPALSKLSDASRLWNVGQRPGNALIAKNRAVQVPEASVVLDPAGTYGKPGFTFNASSQKFRRHLEGSQYVNPSPIAVTPH